MTESINNSTEFTTWLNTQSVDSTNPVVVRDKPSSYAWFLVDGTSGRGVIDATALSTETVSVEDRVSRVLAHIGS